MLFHVDFGYGLSVSGYQITRRRCSDPSTAPKAPWFKRLVAIDPNIERSEQGPYLRHPAISIMQNGRPRSGKIVAEKGSLAGKKTLNVVEVMSDKVSQKKLDSTLAIIMGGGQGSRLFPLTHERSKPAVPLAAKYRIVDIPISNCINSGIRKMYVLTQFNSESLNRHITSGYKFDHFGENFVNVLAAQQTPGGKSWYEGTADAVRKNLIYFLEKPYKYYLILSGDQLYRMDYRKLLARHLSSNADLTVATTPVDRDPARAFGLMHTDDAGKITQFVEKPGDDDALLDTLKMPAPMLEAAGIDSGAEKFQANMGIYLFSRHALQQALDNDLEDFGKHIIPQTIDTHSVYSHTFQGYWEDIGTIKSFFEANLEVTKMVPSFNFFDPHNPIYTRSRLLPASKINNATIEHALISDGTIITHASIKNCVIGVRSVIEPGCSLEDVVLMGSDFYNKKCFDDQGKVTEVPIKIGDNTRIRKAIIDKNAIIGSNVVIDPGERENADLEYAYIRDGIVVVPKGMEIPDGTVV